MGAYGSAMHRRKHVPHHRSVGCKMGSGAVHDISKGVCHKALLPLSYPHAELTSRVPRVSFIDPEGPDVTCFILSSRRNRWICSLRF